MMVEIIYIEKGIKIIINNAEIKIAITIKYSKSQ